MKQSPDTEPLTPEPETARTARDDMETAEPFWMQDVRLATRAIEAERARLRAAREAGSSDVGETTGD